MNAQRGQTTSPKLHSKARTNPCLANQSMLKLHSLAFFSLPLVSSSPLVPTVLTLCGAGEQHS